MTEPVPHRRTFFRLLGFLKPYKVSLIISIVLACGSQAAQIAMVWIVGGVIDKAIAPHDSSLLGPTSGRSSGWAWSRPG